MKEKLNVNQIPELKQAIIDLSVKEKDQLLIRLINKDQLLIEQLHFRLLEDELDLIKRFESLQDLIKNDLKDNYRNLINESENVNAKLLLRLIRNLSSKITHFSKVTKDLNFELELRTILIIESFKFYSLVIKQDSVFGYKLRLYQITRIKLMVKLFDKIHDDLKYDFVEKYGVLLEQIFEDDLINELKQVKISFDVFRID